MASSASRAFSGCNNLAGILDGLQGRAGKAPSVKPQARKRRRAVKAKAVKAKGVKAKGVKAKAVKAKAVKAKAVKAVKAKAVDADEDNADEDNAADKADEDNADEDNADEDKAAPLSMTRRNVTSRAYRYGRACAKAAGLLPAEWLEAAKTAYKVAGAEWDAEHA